MNENLPSPITNGEDLDRYEAYLDTRKNQVTPQGMVNNYNYTENFSYIPTENKRVPEKLKNTAFMPAFLSKHIGKLVRVESLLGNQLHQRTGILMTVGAGFIVLRSQNNATLICDSNSIRFVTIIHDNDLRKLMNNY